MVINQPFGIGDILFIEPILRHFWMKNGEKPILPVRDHLMWLQNHIDSARLVKMSEFKLDYDSMDTSNPDYLPLRFANQIHRGYGPHDHHDFENMMLDKYRLCGLDEELWKTLNIKFDRKKGNELYKKVNPTDRPMVLVNEFSGAGKIEIQTHPNCNRVNMREIEGYTMVDWFMCMILAYEQHHVSTSTFFVLEAIKGYNQQYLLETGEECLFRRPGGIHIYPRPNEDGLSGISQLKPSFEYKLMS